MWADSDLRGSQTSSSSQRLLKHSFLGASRLCGSESSRRDLSFCVSRRFLCQPHTCAGSPLRDKLHKDSAPGPPETEEDGAPASDVGSTSQEELPTQGRAGSVVRSTASNQLMLC